MTGNTPSPRTRRFDPRRAALVLCAGLILICATYLRGSQFYQDLKDTDVYFIWMEGGRLLHGENPYARILGSDLVENQKYATYLPLPYLLAAGLRLLAPGGFDPWLRLWRPLVQLADLGMMLALIGIPWRRGHPLIGLLGGMMWAFSRWSMYDWEVASTEPFVLLSLIGALALWETHPRLAGVLLGVSLGIKHIAVLILPVLFLRPEPMGLRLRRLAWTLLVPAVVTVPFLVWSAKALWLSVLFSATRESLVTMPSSEDSLTMTMLINSRHGLLLRWPILAIFPLFWAAAVVSRLGNFTVAFLAFTLFVAHNPVLFTQYYSWPFAFVPLMIVERIAPPSPRSPAHKTADESDP
jgi:uncharacterized membrane protein